ncbi:MAG: aminopeptidase P family protein [Lachnospiraceae bacterium]|nr:aminopeptidase P family protein [Lachnospiraceae bacterium]
MSEIHAQRIHALRAKMKECGADYYLVPTADFHGSEYVCDHFKTREYLSGFTGSSGTLLIGPKDAYLWTDGRYFIQAAKELEGSNVILMKMQKEGVPTIEEFLQKNVESGQCIAFDGRVMNCLFGGKLQKLADERGAKIQSGSDLAEDLWAERPALPSEDIIPLPDELTGVDTAEKLELVRGKMRQCGASVFLLTKLDDIMWLYNIRGRDIPCNPVALSYAAVTKTRAFIFVQRSALTDAAEAHFARIGVAVLPYEEFYEQAEGLTLRAEAVLLDKRETNYTLYALIKKHAKIVWENNPTTELKAVKNDTELAHMREVFLRDSVCVIRFIKYIKEWMKGAAEGVVQEDPLTEKAAADYMDDLRRREEGFLDLSFETISAYGENAAMMHYSVSEESDKTLQPEGFLLVDSGGQYLGGTTDVTRTIALGNLTEEQKRDFTLVAAGMLRLMNARFLAGCTGRNLDILAREPLWRVGRDYKCGTGHGVGYILNVHEGPQRISFSYNKDVLEAVLKPGMVVTDEPGVYIEGQYGIRTENVMVCQEAERTADGSFLCFEPLTFVPIDKDAIDPRFLTAEDQEMLRAYHRMVYEKTSPYLNEEERSWLREQTI